VSLLLKIDACKNLVPSPKNYLSAYVTQSGKTSKTPNKTKQESVAARCSTEMTYILNDGLGALQCNVDVCEDRN